MPIEITGLSPMLKVTDLAQTVKFYTETLGITVQDQMSDDSGKPSWRALKWGNASVMFYSTECFDNLRGSPVMAGVLYFNPADVHALWAHLKDRAKVACPLEENRTACWNLPLKIATDTS